jgi:putative membrane protein
MLVHAVQLSFLGAAWRALVPSPPRPSVAAFWRLRWIREGVNNLLPVAGIGGELVGARLLTRHGMPLGLAGASATVDMTVEMVTQILFALVGLGLLSIVSHDRAVAFWAALGMLVALLAAAALVAVQRSGLFKLIERGLLRLAERWPGLSLDGISGLHDAVLAIHARRRGLLVGAACHGISWVLGTAEVWIALHALGHPVGLGEALVIESLGAALRTAGFFVPGALGVQEAALILVCGPFGVPAETAVALSMVKRVRELGYGLSGLIAWQWSEGYRLFRTTPSHGVEGIPKSMRGSR